MERKKPVYVDCSGMMGTKDLARYIGMSPAAVRQMRYRGKGPKFTKGPGDRGVVLYSLEDVDAWLTERQARGKRGRLVPVGEYIRADPEFGRSDGDTDAQNESAIEVSIDGFVSVRDAAKFLGLVPATLYGMRADGRGPVAQLKGSGKSKTILYRLVDLIRYRVDRDVERFEGMRETRMNVGAWAEAVGLRLRVEGVGTIEADPERE